MRCLCGHDFECHQRQFELCMILYRQPVQCSDYWCNVFTLMGTCHDPCERILYTLKLLYVGHRRPIEDRAAIVQSTGISSSHDRFGCVLQGYFRMCQSAWRWKEKDRDFQGSWCYAKLECWQSRCQLLWSVLPFVVVHWCWWLLLLSCLVQYQFIHIEPAMVCMETVSKVWHCFSIVEFSVKLCVICLLSVVDIERANNMNDWWHVDCEQ
jgi:hypothetical protein